MCCWNAEVGVSNFATMHNSISSCLINQLLFFSHLKMLTVWKLIKRIVPTDEEIKLNFVT